MNIGFVGLGKLGLPCALAVENKGHTVYGYDVNSEVYRYIGTGEIPYEEIYVPELIKKTKIKTGSLAETVRQSDIIFVAVQTPHDPQFEGITCLTEQRADFNYSYLVECIKEIEEVLKTINQTKIVIVISTVLPGTVDTYIRPILSDRIKLCYNPFFIAMGTTIKDFLDPEFVLFGTEDEYAFSTVKKFYGTLHSKPFYRTSIKNAELIKVSYNTYIGMKIVFANTLMEICHKTGCDVDAVTDALKLATERIVSPKYFSGGMGDGGGCHPRDNIALSWLAQKLDLSFDWFESVMIAREKQTEWLAELMMAYSLPKVILGKAFKPETALQVGSPAILLKHILEKKGCPVTAYDPRIDRQVPQFEPSVFLIGTKHECFKNFSFPKGSVVLDPWRYIAEQEGVTVVRIGQTHVK